ncbi:RNA-directed DNA polymerase, eukaryota [Tanacetum coccineum]
MGTKVTSSSGSVLEEPEIQKLQMQAKIFKENSLNKLNALKSTAQLLENQSIWYQQAFARLFGDSFRTFKFQLSQHMNNLETLLNAETLHEMDSKSALSVIKVQFERFINSDLLKPLDIYSRSFSSDREVIETFRDYTKMTAQTFKETIIQNMNSIEQCIIERASHEQELKMTPRSSMFKRRLITADQASVFIGMMSVHISSGLVLHQMTSDHNRSELGIQDHNNEPSSSKLVPKVVPLAVKTATSRQEMGLLFHLHIAMLRTTEVRKVMLEPASRNMFGKVIARFYIESQNCEQPGIRFGPVNDLRCQTIELLVKDKDAKDGIDDKDNDEAKRAGPGVRDIQCDFKMFTKVVAMKLFTNIHLKREILLLTMLLVWLLVSLEDLSDRKALWDYIRHLVDSWSGESIILGDFNEVRSENERFGFIFYENGANAFNHFITRDGLIDLSLEGYSFTWTHPSASKMSKLDRFLVSEGMIVAFPSLSPICLERHLSDHRPILLRELDVDSILFISLLKNFQVLKASIKQWCKEDNRRSNSSKSSIQARLAGLDKTIDHGKGNVEIVNEKATLLKDLLDLNAKDSLDMAQKAKIHW